MVDAHPDSEPQASYPYATHLNVLYALLETVDVPALVARCTDRWYNQTLCRVNDSVVRLGVVQGEYHWHKHVEIRIVYHHSKGLGSWIISAEPLYEPSGARRWIEHQRSLELTGDLWICACCAGASYLNSCAM